MKIPNSVIYTVGDVLGSWYYSHTKLDTLFGGNGFPGDPPDGNCIQKCQEWMKRANDDPDVDPLELLGRVLMEFMNLNRHDDPKWSRGFQQITAVLSKNELDIDLNETVSTERSSIPEQAKASVPDVNRDMVATPPPSIPIIVLVTVNEHDIHALLDAFVGEGTVPAQVTKGGVTYNDLGTHGGHRIVSTVCEMGAGGIGASQQRTRESIEHWHPRAIIAVGIAFGLDETKQNIGDVLVSTQIQDYELGRLNSDGTLTPRGDKPSSSDILHNRFRQTDATEKRRRKDWPKVRFGLVLSGQKLVDNLDYRESLKALFTEAIGGDMEGFGVYVSATGAKVDWIVVKGICDWGHKKNQADKDVWQKLAAKNAARVLKAALDVGALYNEGDLDFGDRNPNSGLASSVLVSVPAPPETPETQAPRLVFPASQDLPTGIEETAMANRRNGKGKRRVERNRYGLTRHIPEPTKRSVRQRCGFGCVVCGDPFIEYHHLAPRFERAKEHRAEGITILCGKHHSDAHRDLLSSDSVHQHNANPYCLREGHTRDSLVNNYGVPGQRLKFMIGSATFETPIVLMYESDELISFKPPEASNAPWRLSARILDRNGKDLLKIVDNELCVGVHRYDIKTGNNMMEVREGRGDVIFAMEVVRDKLLRITRLDMDCYGVRISSDRNGTFSVSGANCGKVIVNGGFRGDIGIHVRPSAKIVLLGASLDPNVGAGVAMALT